MSQPRHLSIVPEEPPTAQQEQSFGRRTITTMSTWLRKLPRRTMQAFVNWLIAKLRHLAYYALLTLYMTDSVLTAILEMIGFGFLCMVGNAFFNRFTSLENPSDRLLLAAIGFYALAGGVVLFLAHQSRIIRATFLKTRRKFGHLMK